MSVVMGGNSRGARRASSSVSSSNAFREPLSDKRLAGKYAKLARELRAIVGERNVSVENAERIAHSRNANQLFCLKPSVVVFVEREEQLSEILRCVRAAGKREEGGFSLTFAAGRSNRVGAALGDILVRPRNYEAWDARASFDAATGRVEVPLGVTFEQFLDALKTVDASGARDVEGYPPSSKMFCHVVGAAAMSAGASAFKGGTMKDMVDAVKIVLPSGEELWSDDENAIKQTSAYIRMNSLLEFVEGFLRGHVNGKFNGGINSLLETNGLLGSAYDFSALINALRGLVQEYFDAGRQATLEGILASDDKVKSVCGYDLSELNDWRARPSLTKLMVGSEGTLAAIERVRMKTVPASKHVATAAIYFDSIDKMQDAMTRVKKMVERGETPAPAGVEYVDEQALAVVRGAGKFEIPKEAKGMLLIDLSGDEKAGVEGEGEQIVGELHSVALTVGKGFCFDEGEREKLWAARRSMSTLLQKNLGAGCFSAGFVEDVAVPTEKFAEFRAFLQHYFSARELQVTTFGHVEKTDVNLHVHVALSIEQARTLDLKRIADDVHARAVELGGTCAAEHGIGSSFRRDFWVREEGMARYELMRAIKYFVFQSGFLNDGCMFPNQIIDAERYRGADVRGSGNTVKCQSDRKCDVVCPASLEPSNTPLWVQALETGELSLRELRRRVWSCLGCGRCEKACDAGVSSRDLVWELRGILGPSAGKRLLLEAIDAANASEMLRAIGGKTFGLLRACSGIVGVKFPLSKDVLRIDRGGAAFFEELRRRKHGEFSGGTVVYFPGCFAAATGNDARETVELLQKLGKNVVVPFEVECCGLPFLANGSKKEFERKARRNAEILGEYARDERVDAIITHCASCEYAFRELYLRENFGVEGFGQVAAKVVGLGNFVVSLGVSGLNVDGVAYHQPCHQLRPANAKLGIESLPDQCCGMGGTTGLFEYQLTRQIRAKRLEEAKARRPHTLITDCPMCELNLRQGVLEEGIQTRVISLPKFLGESVK